MEPFRKFLPDQKIFVFGQERRLDVYVRALAVQRSDFHGQLAAREGSLGLPVACH